MPITVDNPTRKVTKEMPEIVFPIQSLSLFNVPLILPPATLHFLVDDFKVHVHVHVLNYNGQLYFFDYRHKMTLKHVK